VCPIAGWVRKVEVDASVFTESGHEGFEEAFLVGRLVVGLHENGTHLGLHRPAMGGSPNPKSLSHGLVQAPSADGCQGHQDPVLAGHGSAPTRLGSGCRRSLCPPTSVYKVSDRATPRGGQAVVALPVRPMSASLRALLKGRISDS